MRQKKSPNIYSGLQDSAQKFYKNEHNTIDLGKKIRELRERAGLTGVELCRRGGGIDPRTLNAIEKGRIRTPSIDTLQAIAGGLSCLVRDLFTQAELRLGHNYHLGSPQGAFQIDFPRCGAKVISSTPAIPQFFCGKIILSAEGKIGGELPLHSCPVFVEVLTGKIEFLIEGENMILKEGENLLFNGGLSHQIYNLLNKESVICMVTAPSFFHG